MGNTMKKLHIIKDIFFFIIILLAFGLLLQFGLPYGHQLYTLAFGINYSTYTPPKIIQMDTGKLPPAKGVPILMYHGVTYNYDTTNTQLNIFISQMEMLKRDGYKTISIHDLDLFLQAKLSLPPKPIIITFDDGRKDSYYTTDDVLKKLGFKATMFIATGKQDTNAHFFLSWDELRKMRDSGRWELEAEGRHSHDKIVIDDKGLIGSYLSSRIYDHKTGLESVKDFDKRIEQDYVDGINDIKNNLGIDPKYYAIPLNDYGQNPTNYPEEADYNAQLTKKYFKLAFIEAYTPNEDQAHYNTYRNIYNYPGDDPFTLRRINVRDTSASQLEKMLDENYPQDPNLNLNNKDTSTFKDKSVDLYGSASFSSDGLHLKSDDHSQSAKVIFGDEHWSNYTIEASVKRVTGKSFGIIGYELNNDSYIIFGRSNNGFYLWELKNGREQELSKPNMEPIKNSDFMNLKLIFKDKTVTAYLNNILIFKKLPIDFDKGNIGFKIWDNEGNGESILQSLKVYPTN
jgi:peptidoglycan/xylan/chitin deacetylase (PgdA/CDA1 family)